MDTQPRQGDKEWRAKKLFPLHLSALKLERNIQDMLQCQCRPANQSSATHQMLETRVKYDLKKNQLFSFLPSALHLSNVVCAETYSTAWDSAVRWWTRTHTHTHTHTHAHTKSQMDFLADSTLSPSTKVRPSLALLQEMSGRGSPSATQEIMAALPSTAVTFFSWVMWGWTGGHRGQGREEEEGKKN